MENSKVLAKVADREITQTDVQFFLQNLNPQTAAQFQSEAGQKQILEELINQELFYLDAKDKNMEDEDNYKVSLERLKNNLLKQYAITELLGKVKVSEDEISDFYSDNRSKFTTPKSVRAQHILVDHEDKAKEIAQELKEGKKSFEEAAKEYSSCPSKERGGDLGFFSKGKMVPEFEEAAFNMDVDTISEPVKTQFGFHIIKVVDAKEAGIKSIDEAKPEIEKQLLSQKQQKVYFDKVDELKKNYKIEINE